MGDFFICFMIFCIVVLNCSIWTQILSSKITNIIPTMYCWSFGLQQTIGVMILDKYQKTSTIMIHVYNTNFPDFSSQAIVCLALDLSKVNFLWHNKALAIRQT